MEKYYNIINSLIKENKRYPGCESIIDDIAQEVWTKSKNIIDSVESEEIIINYIERMVNIAMVTVPKRLNIKTRHSSRIQIPAEDSVTEEKEQYSLDNGEEITLEPVADVEENLIADTAEEVLEQPAEEEELLLQEPEELVSEDEIEILAEPDNVKNLSEVNIAEDTTESEEIVELNEPEVDKDLVEKVINGVPADEIPDEDLDYEDIDSVEPLDNTEDAGILEEDAQSETDFIDELNTPFEEDNTLLLDNEEVLTIDSDSSDDIEIFEDNDEEVILTDNEKVTEDIPQPEEISQSEPEEPLSFPDLSCFDADVKPEEIDVDYVYKKLTELAQKRNDIQVMKIFELKYRENKSVSEISQILNTDTESVLAVLGTIVDIVEV